MILDGFAFEKNFRCFFLDNNYTDTICDKEKMEQRSYMK